jgi:Putative beta-barrel porin-2, OmpL-like. bbp2
MRAFGPDIRGVCVLLLVSFCVSAVPGRLFADDDAKNEPVAKPAAAAKTEVPASETTQTAGTSKPILRTTPVTAATSSEGASSTTSVSRSTAVTSGSESTLADSTIGPAVPDELNAGLPAPVADEPGSASDARTLTETEQAPATSAAPAGSQEPQRRAFPSALDGIFPGSDYLGPTPLMGVPDTDPVYPLTKAVWAIAPALKEARIKVYGWVNGGISVSTSNKSNIPESYAIVPNRPELDQAVLRIERLPDTVQTDHVDWGFRLTPMYGIDYRWTTSQGWFSGQLLNHNRLYGFDPVEAYALLYIPHIAKGMVIKAGRYISPPDIEAQLAPDNYLFTHSLMFTVDCYTQTGINADVKLNDQWSVMAGIHAGDDVAPWNAAAHPTGMFMVRWVSKSNNDSIYGGIDSVNDGNFKGGHDNLQQSNVTWTHRFNETGTFLTTTEGYYIYQFNALVGGTVNNGPPHAWFEAVGPGTLIPGNAPAIGVVNYTEWKFSKKDFLSVRPIDYLVDVKGERTGFPTTYSSWTVGVTHRFNELLSVRPEVRYEYAFSARPYDNGTRSGQLMFAIDMIARF